METATHSIHRASSEEMDQQHKSSLTTVTLHIVLYRWISSHREQSSCIMIALSDILENLHYLYTTTYFAVLLANNNLESQLYIDKCNNNNSCHLRLLDPK
jgi:hypothetical protein